MDDQSTVAGAPMKPALAIAAARAWQKAEVEGRVQKAGARTGRSMPKAGAGLIVSARNHFGR